MLANFRLHIPSGAEWEISVWTRTLFSGVWALPSLSGKIRCTAPRFSFGREDPNGAIRKQWEAENPGRAFCGDAPVLDRARAPARSNAARAAPNWAGTCPFGRRWRLGASLAAPHRPRRSFSRAAKPRGDPRQSLARMAASRFGSVGDCGLFGRGGARAGDAASRLDTAKPLFQPAGEIRGRHGLRRRQRPDGTLRRF